MRGVNNARCLIASSLVQMEDTVRAQVRGYERNFLATRTEKLLGELKLLPPSDREEAISREKGERGR